MGMRRSMVGLGLLASLLLAGCGERLLIKGLSLPPGSVEKDFSTDTSTLNPLVAGGSALGGQGTVKRAVMISFDNSAGWDAVRAHIDSRMQAEGFADALDALSSSLPGMGGQFDTGKFMRTYAKTGSRFSAMLMNNDLGAMSDALGQAGGSGAMGGTMPGAPAQFTLFVVEYQGD